MNFARRVRDRNVSRYATEMVNALAAQDRWQLVIHVPADVRVPPAWLTDPRIEIRRSRLIGMLFEQWYLPTATRGEVLLNFTGTAPLLKRRQLVLLQDANVFRDSEQSYGAGAPWRRMAYRWLARTAEGLLTVSIFSANELSDVLHVDYERFIIAGCAADSLQNVVPSPPVPALTGGYYLIMTTGVPRERIRLSLRTVLGSGRRAVVIGNAIGERMYGVRDEPGAVFLGHPADAGLVWLYQHARGLIVASNVDSLGLPALEAQALGCPVVSSDAAAMPEMCRDGALYFDPEDPDSLSTQLERLEFEAGLADDLMQKGLVNARRHSWSDSAGAVAYWCEWRSCVERLTH